MANFDTSNLVVAQTILNDKYAKPEMRMKPSPALGLLLGNANYLMVGVETLKTRDDRAVEAHLMARTKRATGSARSYNHTGTIDDSQKVTLNWITKTDKTTISLKLLNKSVLDFNAVLANKFEQCMMNIIEDSETAAIAYLQVQRSQVSAVLKGSNFNIGNTNNVIEIDATDKKRFFALLKSAMKQNKYGSQLDIIADSLMAVNATDLAAQGAGNATNTAWQFAGLNIAESIELADANYSQGVVLAMPAQSVCALPWIPKENRQGVGDYNSYVGGFGSMKDPWGLGLQFAVHGYAQRTNTSGSNGDTQDVSMEFEFSLDWSWNKAPLSNANETVIFQAGQV